MASDVQLNLFGNNDPISLLMQEVELLREQNNNVRRGLFARHNELSKIVLKQQQEIDLLKGIVPIAKEESEIFDMVLL